MPKIHVSVSKGGSDSVRNMLKYIQNSKAASVVDEATKELDEYVGNVRRDPEIRGDYMTFGDRIDWEKKMSLEEGIEQGLKQGIEKGKLEMIAGMLSNGKTVEEIAEFCGIDPALVLKAKETMQLV